MTYTTVLFDLDHTLFDSDASELDAFTLTLRSAGLDDPNAHVATYRRINTRLWKGVERGEVDVEEVRVGRFAELGTALGLDYDPSEVADEFSARLGECGGFLPGASELIARLAGQVRMGVVTNGVSTTQRTRLQRLGLDVVFEAVSVSGELGVAKPDPAIFDDALAQLGDPPRRTVLMVGDSLTSDIAGARNSAIGSCWFNPVAAGSVARPGASVAHEAPDHEVHSLGSVADVVHRGPISR